MGDNGMNVGGGCWVGRSAWNEGYCHKAILWEAEWERKIRISGSKMVLRGENARADNFFLSKGEGRHVRFIRIYSTLIASECRVSICQSYTQALLHLPTAAFTLTHTMEEPETHQQFEIKEGIAFLIDLSDSIFVPVAELDHKSQLLEILQCINDLMSDMVITFPSNGVGIYLYNAKDTGRKYAKNSGITKIFSLNDLNSSNIKLITNVVRDELDGFKPLRNRYPHAESRQDNLHTVLETILREFQAKPQYNRKRLFWLTSADKPYVNPQLKDGLRTLMDDFDTNKIFVTPVFLESHGTSRSGPMDLLLYENIFLNTNFMPKQRHDDPFSANMDAPVPKTTVSSQIRKTIFRLKEVRRTQFSCDLVLSDGPGIGGELGCSVKGYTLFNHEVIRPFRQVNTEGEGLKLVHHETHYLRRDTKEELDTDEGKPPLFMKGITVKLGEDGEEDANEKTIILSQDTLNYMREYTFDHTPGEEVDNAPQKEDDEDRKPVLFSKPPYLKLLCFRSLEMFQPLFNIKAPVFVTADSSDGMSSGSKDGGYTNSFHTFRQLYRLCIRLGRYAVLFGCVKKNAAPRLYALYPTNTLNSSSQMEDKKLPDGFILIAMPWLGEIRSLPDYLLTEHHRYFLPDDKQVVPQELASVYLKLIDLCQVDGHYDPSQHPNPVLNFFYKTIKQEVLQIDIKDEDASIVHNDWTAQRLIDLRQQLQGSVDSRELFRFINVYLNKIGNAEVTKRMNEDNREGAFKKAKVAPLTEAAIVAVWQTDSWNKVTVAQLKQFMGRYSEIAGATRKAEMVENIIAFLEARQTAAP